MISSICGLDFEVPIVDTMALAYVLGHSVKSLKHLTSFLTNRPGSRTFGSYQDHGYLAEDVLSTRDVLRVLDKPSRTIYARELLEAAIPKFVAMRRKGIALDYELLDQLEIEYEKLVKKALSKLQHGGFKAVNFQSPQQLVTYLQSKGVKLTAVTPSGAFSTNEAALLELTHPAAKQILEYRDLLKTHQWLIAYQKFSSESPVGRLHPRMNLTTTRTGRASCADPNLQQVPRKGPVKKVFISKFEGGYMGLVDLAQAELRTLELEAEDTAFLKALLSEDVHRYMASKAFTTPESEITATQRKKSKGVTFGKIYGGSNKGLAGRLGISEHEVAEVERAIFDAFPGVGRKLRQLRDKSIEDQRVVTAFGRIRDLRETVAYFGENAAGRQGTNTPIQSIASDVMLVIAVEAQRILSLQKARSHLVLGIHDSSLWDIHPDEVEQVARAVSKGFQYLKKTPLSKYRLFGKLPFTGELIVGPTWAHIEDTNEAFDINLVTVWACSSHTTAPELKSTTHYRVTDMKADPEIQALGDDENAEEEGSDYQASEVLAPDDELLPL